MARKIKPKLFYEPWTALKSSAWDLPFKGETPTFQGSRKTNG